MVGKPEMGVSDTTSASWSSAIPEPVNVKAMKAISSGIMAVRRRHSGMHRRELDEQVNDDEGHETDRQADPHVVDLVASGGDDGT